MSILWGRAAALLLNKKATPAVGLIEVDQKTRVTPLSSPVLGVLRVWFKVADEVSYIPADDIVAGPMLTISNLGDIFIINHRPSPKAN